MNRRKKETDDHENVMLLAMSTLPRVPKINTYQIKDENGERLYFKSISQMEPHTKYVLYKLAVRKERLDRIVILESAKAHSEIPQNWGDETATTLFLKRLHNYLGGSESIDVLVQDTMEELEETAVDSEIYHNYFPDICRIDLESPVYFWYAVQAIRGNGAPVHLYMDMQGGDRNAVSQMNAIAELLVRQKVTIMGRFANDFEPKRQPPLHTIRDASREYRTYDLISAMDIFSRYGWGDKLQQYFQGNYPYDSRESRLVKAIKEASMAISRCNADGFDKAVRRIESLKSEFIHTGTEAGRDQSEEENVSEMDVVYQDIYEDYERLFDPEYRYVEQIRWCLDKQFLQQALTILEAKMPYEFVHSGLLYYLKKDGDKEKFFETCEKMYFELDDRNHYLMKDLNHYLIKYYCKEYCKESKSYIFVDPYNLLSFGLGEKRKKEVYILLNKYRSLCGLRNQINHAAVGEHDPNGFFCHMKRKYEKDANWKKQKNAQYEKKIRDFLNQWEQLAKQVPQEIRNQIEDAS